MSSSVSGLPGGRPRPRWRLRRAGATRTSVGGRRGGLGIRARRCGLPGRRSAAASSARRRRSRPAVRGPGRRACRRVVCRRRGAIRAGRRERPELPYGARPPGLRRLQLAEDEPSLDENGALADVAPGEGKRLAGSEARVGEHGDEHGVAPVKTPWGQRLIPVDELVRFVDETSRSAARVPGLARLGGRRLFQGPSSIASSSSTHKVGPSVRSRAH